MLIDTSLFLAALLLGLLAAVLGRRRPPALDPGRLLAVCQSALLWGLEEGGDGSTAAWTARVEASVCYHPAGRQGWQKLDGPETYAIPVPSLPGERALVEALRTLAPGRARFERLFGDDAARAALLDDPRALGEAYDPGRWLGHGCDWEVLARWGEPVRAAVRRRLEHQRVVFLAASDATGTATALHEALLTEGAADLVEVEGPDPAAEPARQLAERLRALAPEPADRLVLAALGDAGPLVLAAMRADPELRDRVVALIFDGCPLGGVPADPPAGLAVEARQAWLAEHFRQDTLDTELRRSTAYCTLARLERDAVPAGDGRVPWAQQVLVEPPTPPSGRRPIAVVDLGAALAGRPLPAEVEVRALRLLLAFLLGEGLPRP